MILGERVPPWNLAQMGFKMYLLSNTASLQIHANSRVYQSKKNIWMLRWFYSVSTSWTLFFKIFRLALNGDEGFPTPMGHRFYLELSSFFPFLRISQLIKLTKSRTSCPSRLVLAHKEVLFIHSFSAENSLEERVQNREQNERLTTASTTNHALIAIKKVPHLAPQIKFNSPQIN